MSSEVSSQGKQLSAFCVKEKLRAAILQQQSWGIVMHSKKKINKKMQSICFAQPLPSIAEKEIFFF